MSSNMSDNLKAESGFQLVLRFNDRPSLAHLDDVLFPMGPKPGDIIQVSGEAGVGKSLLLLKFLTKALLPKNFKGVPLGGLEVSVVFIDTGAGISILRLVCLMEKFITAIHQREPNREDLMVLGNTVEVEKIINDCLKNLVILKTYNAEQLEMNFHSIEKILATDTNMSLILIDSLTSFYWSEVTNQDSIKNMDLYLKSKLDIFLKYAEEYETVVVFTTQGIGIAKINSACGYFDKFEELSNAIKTAHPGVEINPKSGSPGTFEITINGELVYSKIRTMAFPDIDNVLEVVKEVESGMPPRKIEKQQPITSCIVL